jgi:hypothetical protein
MTSAEAPVAPSPLPANPNLKRPIGISLSPGTDRVLVQWVDYKGKIRTAGRKPTRGTVIEEIVEKLLSAGWTPGDQIIVARDATPKPTRKK